MDAVDWMQNEKPSFDDPIAFRVRRVMKIATEGEYLSSKIISGAINDVYERCARDFLERTVEEAQALGFTAEENEAHAADYIRLGALEAVLMQADAEA